MQANARAPAITTPVLVTRYAWRKSEKNDTLLWNKTTGQTFYDLGMPMTFKQLEAFYYAATLGSFALAAQRTHVTHSSLSKRIAELEAWVGRALFDRSGKSAQLTEAGVKLMPYASNILQQKEEVRASLSGTALIVGNCQLGITELGALTWLPSLVREAKTDHPALLLKPYVSLGRHLGSQVARGELDCAVISGPVQDPRLVAFPVASVDFVLTASPGRVSQIGEQVEQTLARHPLITVTEGSGSTRTFEAWSQERGIRMQHVVASNSLMAIIGLTIADLGVSVLPKTFIQPWVRAGLLAEVQNCNLSPAVPFNFIQRDDDHRNMLAVMRQYVGRLTNYSAPASFTM